MSMAPTRESTTYGQTASPFSPQEIVQEMLTTAEVWDELLKRRDAGDRRADVLIKAVIENHVPVLAFVGPKGLAINQQVQQQLKQVGRSGYGGYSQQ